MPHLSITGLTVRHVWHVPVFWHYSVRAMARARSAPGCLSAEARTIGGVHHTRSLWRERSDMLAYLQSDAHLDATRAFPRIATGRVLGFEAETVPDWDAVHRLWQTQGRDV